MKYDILSPDGFSMHPTDTYKTKVEAFKKFEEWKEGYKRQGYYSSPSFGRIPLDELSKYCKLVAMKRGQSLFEGVKTNLFEEIQNILQNLSKSNIEMLSALKQAKRMYEKVQPAGGWQGVYDAICNAINNQIKQQ